MTSDEHVVIFPIYEVIVRNGTIWQQMVPVFYEAGNYIIVGRNGYGTN